MKRVVVAMILCSAVGLGCRGDSGGGGVVVNFYQVCVDACQAMYREPCQGMDASQCEAGCAAAASSMEGPCGQEMAAMYRCSATLSFTCTADGPQPAEVGCVEQTMAYVECLDTAPCLGHCDAAVAAGCGGSGEQACLDACEAELEAADWCDFEMEDLFECHGENGVACVEGEPTSTAACSEEALEMASCVADDAPCRGFCLAARVEGCAEGGVDACAAACEGERDSDCTSEYDRLLECGAREGVTCAAGAPAASEACASEQATYDSCAGAG